MNIENGKVLAENDSAFGDSGKTNSYTVTCQASKDGNPQIELSGNITIPSYISFSVANSSGVIVTLSGNEYHFREHPPDRRRLHDDRFQLGNAYSEHHHPLCER